MTRATIERNAGAKVYVTVPDPEQPGFSAAMTFTFSENWQGEMFHRWVNSLMELAEKASDNEAR